ncbi:MAG: hypothetical protein CMD31_06230 [Flavobacteriales bacterium]|jgi:hypothetical protein|nr:hypothetical protein [Flavobacteriales bacterium]MBQ20337.1 hypothetical protein [Flavobacteriales bacterium]|tara:strand:- start:42149 stop:43048 length:900 start_codon:yes stop_codon:yes gene_type:complete
MLVLNKMKYYLLVIAIMLSNFLIAQDYIVINGDDTVYCKIESVGAQKIFFSIPTDSVPYNSSLLLSQVNSYYFNHSFEQQDTVITVKKIKKERVKIARKSAPLFRFSASYGLGYFDYQNTKENAYSKELKSGYNATFEAHYFPEGFNYGLGIKASNFTSKHQVDNMSIVDEVGNTLIGQLRDDITMNYLAGSFVLRWLQKDFTSGVYIDFSFGKTFYINNNITLTEKFKTEANGYAFNVAAGYDYKLWRNLAIGLNVAYNRTYINEMEINGETFKIDKEYKESQISRYHFVLGIRYLFK